VGRPVNASGKGPESYDAGPFLPSGGGLPAHRKAAATCRGCPLYEQATQTVFGSGSASARIVVVGEQPGDQEDRRGEPFVGPAGQLLHKALDEAGLGQEPAYVTNAVKHFKFVPAERGKRRIHKPPSLREMRACRPWLAAELRLLSPEVVVALGATAGRALLGPDFRVTRDRGTVLSLGSSPDEPADEVAQAGSPEVDPQEKGGRRPLVVATVHPSAVLRAPDRDAVYAGLVADLKVAASLLRPAHR
jgi:DNA polymerase